MRSPAPDVVPWRDVALFVTLAIGLCWASRFAVEAGWDPLWNVVAVYSPLLAAVVMRKAMRREGFADAHLGIRGVKLRFWVVAALLPLAWNLVHDLFDVVAGICKLHPGEAASGVPRVLRALPGMALFLVGEEIGWRSYLVEKLRPAGPVVAFAITGLVWFTWHPSVWFGHSATLRGGITFAAEVMCLSFVFGWLYEASGSVWPCLALHVFTNAAGLSSIKGALTCLPDTPVISDLAEVLPLLVTTVVLWRAGALRRRDQRFAAIAS